ncbi:hypothetical protein ACFE04_012003 [Oxalis oulophora]
MVNFLLRITGDLENVANLQPQGGCDDPNFSYFFKLKCGSCGEVTEKETCVQLSDTMPLPTGRGTTNLIQKCKFCGREGTVTMVTGRGAPLTLDTAEKGDWASIMKFDCRGFEPLGFVFGDGWKVQSVAGTVFENVDLSEEFYEYDEKGEVSVMISNLSSEFKVDK